MLTPLQVTNEMNSLRTKRIEILQGMQGTKIRQSYLLPYKSMVNDDESEINTTYLFMEFILYKFPVKMVYDQFVVCISYMTVSALHMPNLNLIESGFMQT